MLRLDTPPVLFSRYEDGALPVTFLPDGWEIHRPGDPQVQKFSTAKGLLVALTGHPEGRHWSLERYFRLTPRKGYGLPLEMDIYDIWPVADPTAPVPLLITTAGISIPAAEDPRSHSENVPEEKKNLDRVSFGQKNVLEEKKNLSTDSFGQKNVPEEKKNLDRVSFGQKNVLEEKKKLAADSENVGTTFSEVRRPLAAQRIGIDLARRGHEVRKLLFAGFGRRMFVYGYDPEDVLQEVYKGLLIRNEGKCPWDPAKSSFSHYVHMVCSCILSNYHRKQRRVREMEQVGLLNPMGSEGEGTRYTDVASNVTVASRSMLVQEDCLMLEEAEDLLVQMRSHGPQDAESRLAARVLPLLLAGTPREAMAITLGVSAASLSRAMSHLRKQATTWAENRA